MGGGGFSMEPDNPALDHFVLSLARRDRPSICFLATASGDPVAIYAAIRPDASAGYGGLIFDGSDWLLSFSPELFFSLRGRAAKA